MKTLPDLNLDWAIPLTAVSLIAGYESLRLRAYLCPAKRWTCGWGETVGVTPTTVWTKQEADHRFCQSVREVAAQVIASCTLHPTANQLGALVSFVYNIGIGAFRKSSILKLHNKGNFVAASRAFNLYNKSRVDGVLAVLAGLTARRASEQALYLTPEPDAAPLPMPQAVVPESSLTASPTIQTGAGLVSAGALSSFTEVSTHVKTIASDLDVSAVHIVGVLAVVAGVVVLYNRYLQRREGWA